jgi:hypothetical protein
MGMGMGVNPYPPVYMGNPVGLFLCCVYGYGVLIPGGYLPIAISRCGVHNHGLFKFIALVSPLYSFLPLVKFFNSGITYC